MITFFVPGIPATQGSKKWIGGHRIIDTCKSLPQWRRDVATVAKQYAPPQPYPKAVDVALFLTFVLPRPKGHYGTGRNAGIVKPSAPQRPRGKDLTKMVRAVEDAMSGIIYADDDQICQQVNNKEYGEYPGVHVDVFVMEVGE